MHQLLQVTVCKHIQVINNGEKLTLFKISKGCVYMLVRYTRIKRYNMQVPYLLIGR